MVREKSEGGHLHENGMTLIKQGLRSNTPIIASWCWAPQLSDPPRPKLFFTFYNLVLKTSLMETRAAIHHQGTGIQRKTCCLLFSLSLPAVVGAGAIKLPVLLSLEMELHSSC